MDLDTYLRDEGISGAEFAARLGLSEASLSRIRRGDQNITRETIRAIVEASEGRVTAEALVFHPHDVPDSPDATSASQGKGDEISPLELAPIGIPALLFKREVAT